MSALDPSAFEMAVKKSIYGVVENLDTFFLGYRYDKQVRNKRGSVTDRPKDFYFLSSEHPAIEMFQSTSDRPTAYADWSLGVKVNPYVIKAVENYCCEGKIGALHIIPWKHTGHALILASDAVHIARPYLGFVPLCTLPVINKMTHPLGA